MNTLKDVKTTMRAIAGDPDGEWLTDSYVIPIINHVYNLQINYLANLASTFIEEVREVLGVPTGTTDLTPWQRDPKKALYGLLEPDNDGIEWKQAGQPDQYYVPAKHTKRLPNVTPAGPGPRFQLVWEFRSFRIFITPMTFDIDLRVRGDFNPPPLRVDDDYITVHPRMGDVLAEEAMACAYRERSNPGQLQSYQLVYTAGLDDIANQLTRGEQGVPIRVARMNSRYPRG